jgi:rhodanese-related sulfurtransferase
MTMNMNMNPHKLGLSLAAALLCSSTSLACSDDGGGEDEVVSSDSDTTGDGDTGDGDGDTGDGDGDGDAQDNCAGIVPTVTELTPDELSQMLLAKDFELINVHIPYAGEIPDTDIHIPFTDIDALEAHLDDDHGNKAVLYCLTGPMSAIAAAELIDLGYCEIFDMPAGMIGWEAEGNPVDPLNP